MSYAELKPAFAKENPSVSAEQVRLVRESFDLVASGNTAAFKQQSETEDPSVHLALTFYGRLFELDPGAKALFKKPISQQGGMLIKTLALSLSLLEDLPALVPKLQSLAARHVRYGSTIAQYGTVGEALIWALQQVAGDAFTPAHAEAWIEVYSVMLTVMIPAQLAADAKAKEAAAAKAATAAPTEAVTLAG